MPSCEDTRYGAMGPFKWQKEDDKIAMQMVTRVSGYRGSKTLPERSGQVVVFLTVGKVLFQRTRASQSWLIEHELMSPWL